MVNSFYARAQIKKKVCGLFGATGELQHRVWSGHLPTRRTQRLQRQCLAGLRASVDRRTRGASVVLCFTVFNFCDDLMRCDAELLVRMLSAGGVHGAS